MGGRGASSGRYYYRGAWHTYGDEFHSVYQYRNIKFVKVNEGSNRAPMETTTQGRVYVTVGEDDKLKSITYYSGSGKRRKQIDLTHPHILDGDRIMPHTHLGYIHDENGNRAPTKKETKMIDNVLRIWYNRPRP